MPVGEGNKKPGDLAAHPGLWNLPAITWSLEDLLRSVRARIRLAWRDWLSLLLESQMSVHRNSIHIGSPNAVLAAALTLQKQKARSARAVRASDGRKALTRSSSPEERLQEVSSVAPYAPSACASCSQWARIVVLKKAKSIPICAHRGCDPGRLCGPEEIESQENLLATEAPRCLRKPRVRKGSTTGAWK